MSARSTYDLQILRIHTIVCTNLNASGDSPGTDRLLLILRVLCIDYNLS